MNGSSVCFHIAVHLVLVWPHYGSVSCKIDLTDCGLNHISMFTDAQDTVCKRLSGWISYDNYIHMTQP